MPLLPTQRLHGGRYVLLGLLRAGGEAEVWRALDTSDGQERALKVFVAADGGADAAARELALARRVAHPSVVRVDDAFVDGEHAFVVMELAEGSLAERVAASGPLTPAEAFAALEGPLAALEAAHAAGVVHRDVKPHNLLVFGALDGPLVDDGSGRPRAVVKLADFGIAQVRAEGLTRTRSGAFLGSLPFMSPEQRRDPRNVGPATDVYAAAVTLAWLVTGKAPGDLYLPETLAELRADLRARGLAREELERVVGVVEVGGRADIGRSWSAGRSAFGRPVRPVYSGTPLLPRRIHPWLAMVGGAACFWAATTSYRYLAPASGAEVAQGLDTMAPCSDYVRTWLEQVHMGPRETTDAQLADVDGDGLLDVLFANHQDASVSLWWGRRNELPSERTDVPMGRIIHAPAVGDIDGDGVRDLVGAEPDGARLVLVRGRSGRTFDAAVPVPQDPAPMSAALVDMDGDARLDILMTHEPSSDINVRKTGTGFGALLPHRLAYRFQVDAPHWLLAQGDVPRLIVQAGRVLQEVSLAAGRAGLPATLAAGLSPVDIISDATRPESPVIVLSAADSLVLARFTPDGLCRIGSMGSRHRPRAIGDLDGDGLPDVVEPVTCQRCESNHVFWRGVR